MKWYRRAIDPGTGENGYGAYYEAKGAYVLSYGHKHREILGEAGRWLINNDRIVPYRLDWPTEHEAEIKGWLRLNSGALAAIRKAAACPRCIPTGELQPPPDLGPNLLLDSDFDRLSNLYLAEVAAIARDGGWSAAYRNWATAYRIAAHSSWNGSMTARTDIEAKCFEQFALLAEMHSPSDIADVRRAVREAWALRTPSDDEASFVLRLTFAAMSERDHAWARNDPSQSEHHHFLSLMLMGQILDRGDALPFKNVDEYKTALLSGSPDSTFRVLREMDAASKVWDTLPHSAVLAKLPEFRSEQLRIAQKDPWTRFYLTANFPAVYERLIMANQLLYRRGLLAVFAILEWKAEHQLWPESLDALKLGEDAIDPFSGKPLIYRRADDGNSFVLYSVGVNLTDDGGVEPSNETAIEEADGDIVLWPRKAPEYVAPSAR